MHRLGFSTMEHRTWNRKVVVVTGASSGLGRATAVQFAAKSYKVVLAARRLEALEQTERLCREAGGDALCVVTDVTREEDVNRLMRVALAVNGAIDVWVNNAGVTLFGPLEEAPFEDHRRVLETNVFGPILCARAVVPIFRKQGRGVMINVGSILGKVGQPFVPSYVISKFALRGLTDALRAELAELRNVHICNIYPYAMDTPHFESGGNSTGRAAHPMPPTQSPEKVARVIVKLAEHPRRERHVPRYAVLGLALHALMPRPVERAIADSLRHWHFGSGTGGRSQGNLFAPTHDPPGVHGRRRPRASAPRFFMWLAGRLLLTPRLRRPAIRPAPEPTEPARLGPRVLSSR